MYHVKDLERYQWILTPDGSGYILVDTQANTQVVGAWQDNAPIATTGVQTFHYETSTAPQKNVIKRPPILKGE